MIESPDFKDNEPRPDGIEPPISLLQILRENPFLVKMIIFFFLMLSVPLVIAWKFNLFLVANN
jgi:hypothetical protein